MLDNRLIEADATKLDELREILKAQENSDKLCGIGMKEIHIEHGAAKKVCQAVKSLTDGKKGADGNRSYRDRRCGREKR